MKKNKKKENPFMNLVFNLAIPIMILMKFSKPEYLGQKNGLILALAFPITYGIYDAIKNREINKFSIIGLVSIFLTGVIGLLKLPPELIAIKEAAVPSIIGIAVLITAKTKKPITKIILMNDSLFQLEKIESRLKETNNEAAFEKKLYNSTFILALSFLVSAILNYVLAKVVVVSEPGTDAFNNEVGKMLAYSFPVITIPSMIILGVAIWYLISNLTKLTGLSFEDIMIDTKKNSDSTEKEDESSDKNIILEKK